MLNEGPIGSSGTSAMISTQEGHVAAPSPYVVIPHLEAPEGTKPLISAIPFYFVNYYAAFMH